MHEVLRSVEDWLEANGIAYSEEDEGTGVLVKSTGTSCPFNITLAFHEEVDLFVVFVDPEIAVPKKFRKEVAGLIAHANSGGRTGSFEIDMESGKVFLTVTQLVRGSMEDWAIERMFSDSVKMMDRFVPGLEALIKKGVSAKKAAEIIFRNDNGFRGIGWFSLWPTDN